MAGVQMDLEEILYYLRGNKVSKKWLFAGCLIIIFIGIILLACTVILVAKYHTQIYNGFMGIINFIFGDSLESEIRSVLKQITDNYLSNLFKGE